MVLVLFRVPSCAAIGSLEDLLVGFLPVGPPRHFEPGYPLIMDVSLACPALWQQAVHLFGGPEKATRWLRTPLSELNDQTPEEVLSTGAGTDTVEAILDRIEYGVFS
jgi:Protein of unknown function (DUF2384)